MGETNWSRMLVEQRNRSGFSRSELAARAGLSYPYVSQLETGLRKPSRKAAAQLADALGIDPLELERSILSEESPVRSLRAAAPVSVDALEMGSVDDGRDGLIEQLVDLVEEVGPEDRIDLLADLQREVLRRLSR